VCPFLYPIRGVRADNSLKV